ncbi:hypothetical protein E6C60_3666 [Paenibacillus algicola]|uniref:Uncharacterized protein n=1 Tax=Paenibacillus algicola TaxID=2565926 RepID=A0A4V1G4E1_9BACL|nr:TnsD family Tn7-like transposition protein [Paenibacillus algicola]QCT04374.1 hypothetical protein E6C60_3666 [Paenibacillus algicola]
MGRIVAFPPTYPDEDFRSIVHRYHLQSPYTFTQSKRELFGKHVPKKGMLYPKNLSQIISQLGVTGLFAERLIQNHTYYPFLRSFLSHDLLKQFQEAMYNDSHTSLLIINTIQTSVHVNARYCPECMHEDYQRYQIVYLHRTHQFSFLSKCLVHGSKLIEVCPVCRTSLINQTGSQMPIEPICSNGHAILPYANSNPKIMGENLQLLNDITTLMNPDVGSLDTIHLKLVIQSGAKGYIHFRGDFIYKKRLLTDMVDYYGKPYLASLGLSPDHLMREKMLVRFLQKDSLKSNIILYLLLMRFFAGSVENFMKSNMSYALPVPFGTGPWLCVNALCSKYNKGVIKRVTRKAHEWVTGCFICPHCGLIYTRTGFPKEEDEKQFTIDTMGPLFVNKAIHYYEKGLNFNEIAEHLNSNRNTVTKYLKPYIGQKPSKTYSNNVDPVAVIELGFHQAVAAVQSKKEHCRNTILEAIEVLGPHASRPDIRKYNNHRYDWLMKNDRPWLEEHLPPRKRSPKKLDLEKLDEEIYVEMKKAVDIVKANPPRKQIKISNFLREGNSCVQARYYTFRQHLPLTRALLEVNIESIDDYAIRIFPIVVERFLKSRYKRLSLKLLQKFGKVYKKCSVEILKWAVSEAERYAK